ncbi:hypothetical protein [Legionella feeleii]|uniref:Coiled-coil protein n=1 Tax=Legionella feeleii TaxID=453 RepID=A0A0W0U1U4_9GAMM|nr:hypothetical protein [Legionella feeleii]KTD01872.1 hypothetical protein Lfee_0919 [Legionella feeleii]
MPFYPDKKTDELFEFLNDMLLHELVALNHSYGPHFEALEDKIERTEQDIRGDQEQLVALQERYDALERQSIAEAEKRKEAFASLPGNGAERYLQLGFFGVFSVADSQQGKVSIEIKKIKERIKNNETQLSDLIEEKKASMDELIIVNSVLALKRKRVETDHLELSSSSSPTLRN